MSEELIEEEKPVKNDSSVEIEYDYVALLQGSLEDRVTAIYELEKPSREAYIAKKKVAVTELIALGISEESARLLAGLYDHEV